MPKKFTLDDAQLQWLRENQHLSFAEQSRRIGVCVDTLKRLLMRHKIRVFEGAKYASRPKPKMWNRPCLTCGTTKSRPKWQFICDRCKARRQEHGLE